MKRICKVVALFVAMVTVLMSMTVVFAETYKVPDEGRKIKEIQKYLVACGYSLNCDGAFGPKTEKAVKAFQKKAGLEVTGEVDGKTFKALKKAAKGKEDSWYRLENYASKTDHLLVIDLSDKTCALYHGRSGHWKLIGRVSCKTKGLKKGEYVLGDIGNIKFCKVLGLKAHQREIIDELDVDIKVVVQP